MPTWLQPSPPSRTTLHSTRHRQPTARILSHQQVSRLLLTLLLVVLLQHWMQRLQEPKLLNRHFRTILMPRLRPARMQTPPFRATSMQRQHAHKLLSRQMLMTLTLSRQRFHPPQQHRTSWQTRLMWIRAFRPTLQPRQRQDRMRTPPFRATSMQRQHEHKPLSRPTPTT